MQFLKLLIPISNSAEWIKQSSKIEAMTPESKVNL